MKVQWHTDDPATGETRFFKAELFGGYWTFRRRMTRRSDWKRVHPTRAMWMEVLDFLERAEGRRLSTADQIRSVKKILAELPPDKPRPPEAEEADEAAVASERAVREGEVADTPSEDDDAGDDDTGDDDDTDR